MFVSEVIACFPEMYHSVYCAKNRGTEMTLETEVFLNVLLDDSQYYYTDKYELRTKRVEPCFRLVKNLCSLHHVFFIYFY